MINLSIMQIAGISCLILAGLITIVLIATYKSVWCSEPPKEPIKEPIKESVKEPDFVKEVTEDLKEIIKKEIKKELSKQSV